LDFIWYWSITFIHIKSIWEPNMHVSHWSHRKNNYTNHPRKKEDWYKFCLKSKDIRLNNLKGVSLEDMAMVREWFACKEKQIKMLEAKERNTHTKTSSSVKYSGATTPRKKPLGSIEKIF
jgi:hypothetical protein